MDNKDHCRIGSLEISSAESTSGGSDHCRIGSLEKQPLYYLELLPDHCRIGSLEMSKTHALILLKDHCRIGSLENALGGNGQGTTRSLPHRQLRNLTPVGIPK